MKFVKTEINLMNCLRTKIAQGRWPNWALLTIEHILDKTHYENIISDFD